MNTTRYPANQAETQDDQPTTASEPSTVPGESPYPADGEPRYDEASYHQESPYPEWEDEPEEEFLPPRPRSRLFRPATVLLFAALMASAGFLGGVLIEKHQLPASTAGASTTRSLASTSSGRSASSGAGGAAASANSIVGQVSTVSGGTLYVTDTENADLLSRAGRRDESLRTRTGASSKGRPTSGCRSSCRWRASTASARSSWRAMTRGRSSFGPARSLRSCAQRSRANGKPQGPPAGARPPA
jgi:hypothetical protein